MTNNGTKKRAAVQLGRLGGLKGGKATAEARSPEERSDAARRAVNARWRKHREQKLANARKY
jgi:hypothetical protein